MLTVQTVVLAITACIVVWYTIETRRMRREITRQISISLRPVVVLDFQQDVALNRVLVAKNIGQGAAFNVAVESLSVVPGYDSWDIRFEGVHWLASQDRAVVVFGMPGAGRPIGDGGHIFFPQAAEKNRKLRIEYQDVEGQRYRQDLEVLPKEEDSLGSGHVIYAPIEKL